ncbi:hypothetical protein [Pelagicoccus mobilis]|uniref:Uncharacterized protein n=1 Tax=Pelagicoccus mobilis TaxID=415221 RepID=A0A934RS65_9BACT|nr:hypothetical protein [Pelagicoccus mobilis]MBK1875897.1 hypothetical protein [Pelagicoccus mobilis]
MITKIQSDLVSAEVVVPVGHIAPVEFCLDESGKVAKPYSLPGWTPEECKVDVPAVKWLRGEFFGFPFGPGQDGGPVHGPAANGPWDIVEKTKNSIRLTVELPQQSGLIEKCVELRNGHRALYIEHKIEGVEGRFNYGHHPVLYIPEKETVQIRINAFKFGSVYPEVFGDASTGDINVLKEGARFESIDELPLREGGTLSVAEYPNPLQYEDLVMMSAADDVRLGWTAVSYDGYVWLSLRSTKQFPSTLFWLSNGGCAQEPWNNVNGRRIGVEDVCSYFSIDCERSRENPLEEFGIETAKEFTPRKETYLRHTQLVHPTDGVKPVASVSPVAGEANVLIRFEDGDEVEVAVDWQWLLEPDQ